jgi:Zn-dependent M28 family amino/carboxypeptidase
MRILSPTLPLLAALLTTAATAAAQNPSPAADTTDFSRRFAATITAADLEKHLRVLASDEYEGRETGQKGQKMAADYLAKQFAALGLRGPVTGNADSPYLQHFELVRTRWTNPRLQMGGKKLEYLKDYYPVGTADLPKGAKLKSVFVGFGIEENGTSDYTGTDVRGKVVVLWQGEPTDERGVSKLTGTSSRSSWTTDVNRKLALAKAKGAVAVLLISERSESNFKDWIERAGPHMREARVGFPVPPSAATLPAFVIRPNVGAGLLSGPDAEKTGAKYTKRWPWPSAEIKLGGKIRLQSRAETTPFQTENVLGYLEGTDQKDELLVLSAHYDHLGIKDGKVYNGADDDGSGTVAVLEMAQAFADAKKAGHGPRRSILFLAVTGEEKGLLGSEYYSDHPVFPLAGTVVNLNTDMIGRLDAKHAANPNYVYLIGDDKLASALHVINQTQNQRYAGLELDYTFNDPDDPNRFYYRSDHYNFARKGIPVAFYFNGVHPDYHQETDEVEKILFPKMERITRLIFHTAWEVANRDERLKVDSNKP